MFPEEVSKLVFFVNGKKVTDDNADPEWTLLRYLREKLRLCGTKQACGTGGCGACTVMISRLNRETDKIIHLAVNACLVPICSMHGLAVTTVEGIGSVKTRLHPVQERIAKAHGTQCGYCTPGIVMSMYTLLRNTPKPNYDELTVTFQGNLCRCTGYRPILEGYKTFLGNSEVMRPNCLNCTNSTCAMGDSCCKSKKQSNEEEVLFKTSDFIPYDPSQQPIFPPELKVSDDFDKQDLFFGNRNVKWFRPCTLEALLDLKQTYPDARIVVGNTQVGLEIKYLQANDLLVLIQPCRVKELTSVSIEEGGIRLGAAVTFQGMEDVLKDQIATQPKIKTGVFQALMHMLNRFGGKQIRNVSSIGGNIMTGNATSDLNPIFLAANAVVEVTSKSGGLRKITMDETFFIGYRTNVVKPDEILVAINLPYTTENQYFYAYKQARRRDDDTAIVNAAFNVIIETDTNKVIDIHMAYGGMASTTVLAAKTRLALLGKEWNDELVETGYSSLIEELPLPPNAHKGMVLYRRSLALSFFYRVYLQISKDLQISIDPRYLSALGDFRAKPLKSSQYFQVIPSTQEKVDAVGRPIVHVSAYKQTTGEATYCGDIPRFENELYMAYVYSTEAHAEILSIDPDEALAMTGVHRFFCAKDMEGYENQIGSFYEDEKVFATKKVESHGQVVGAIVADDQITAQKAARNVKVKYKRITPVIISVDDAIKHKSFHYPEPVTINCGDVDKTFKEAPHVVENDCRTGGQEHFYMETHVIVAVPKKEDNEIEIYSSTQHPVEMTASLSHVIKVSQNKITTKVKRIGGGFGGKETKGTLVGVPVAFVAHVLQRPVRMMLDRDEDMLTTGGRHPFYMKYKVAFDDDGKLMAMEATCYCNAGRTRDVSLMVMQRALLHIDNSYKIPNMRLSGYVCKTNIHSNTAFRAFGAPQVMFCAETMIRHVAEYLKKDVLDVTMLNLYKEGETTHFNQPLPNCTLDRCWQACIQNSKYTTRKSAVDIFNKENRWKKRGIAVVPCKYGIAFTVTFLNQGGALVNIYTDGSVLISHGGIEMGQGIHTKMLQVASRELKIPIDKIYIKETSTDKVPNTTLSAASTGSDLNGMAVMRACQTLMERLQPVIEADPKGTWENWILTAYCQRINLSAVGHYATPNLGYDWKTNTGTPFNYFTYGVACTEVEVDCLTGDHQVLRTDIVMDIGESLNPAIDVGQIEGAFMQGYGLFFLEEMVYLSDGCVYTRGPGTYKIPGFSDIPAEFNVELLKGAPNPRAIYSSKGVGEPPLFLASSAFFAAREAVMEARTETGCICAEIPYRLDAPATSEKLRMACQDHITSKFVEPPDGSYTPWNIIP